MLVKICGIKYKDNLEALIKINPDFLGFIFYPGSKRFVGNNFEKEMLKSVPGTIKKTGVFVNAEESEIISKVRNYNLDLIQLHGDESPDYCSNLKDKGIRIMKTFRVDDRFNFNSIKKYFNFCDLVLFDTFSKKYGGTGKKFEWQQLESYVFDIPFFLSGGIGTDDVERIKEIKHPAFYGIDINSGFESEPGRKKVKSIYNFFCRLGINNVGL